jgi:agmatinase
MRRRVFNKSLNPFWNVLKRWGGSMMGIKDGSSTLPPWFMGSCGEYHKGDIIMVGVPMDFTCSFRPGTRFGPSKVREVSYGIEEFSFYQKKSLEDKSFFDGGDLDLPIGDVEGSLEIIGSASREIFQDHKKTIFIGGEHLISFPVIRAAHQIYGDDLCVLQFDAHGDLREEYLGKKNSHATVIRRLTDFMKRENIYQFGIRSGTQEEFLYGEEKGNFYPFHVFEPLKKVLENLKERPLYITLDIDVLDPAFANGTGTPEPGGISSTEIFDALLLLKNFNIIGFDLVEISPPYDHSDRTAVLGAKIIREMLLLM